MTLINKKKWVSSYLGLNNTTMTPVLKKAPKSFAPMLDNTLKNPENDIQQNYRQLLPKSYYNPNGPTLNTQSKKIKKSPYWWATTLGVITGLGTATYKALDYYRNNYFET